MKLSLRATRAHLAVAAAIAIGLGSAACTKTSLAPGATFAEIDGGAYAYRASSADGVVVAARAEDNDPVASVEYWSRAADRRLRRDGYTPEGISTVASEGGLEGRLGRYSREEGGRIYRYWLTVFVTPKRVYLVEAGGDARHFDPAEAEVERAVRSLRPN